MRVTAAHFLSLTVTLLAHRAKRTDLHVTKYFSFSAMCSIAIGDYLEFDWQFHSLEVTKTFCRRM